MKFAELEIHSLIHWPNTARCSICPTPQKFLHSKDCFVLNRYKLYACTYMQINCAKQHSIVQADFCLWARL